MDCWTTTPRTNTRYHFRYFPFYFHRHGSISAARLFLAVLLVSTAAISAVLKAQSVVLRNVGVVLSLEN
jgi:hypothetical protein